MSAESGARVATAGPEHALGRVRDLARAGAAPLACGLVLIVLLMTWVATGGGGQLSRVTIRIIQASVPMPSFTAQGAAGRDIPVFLTIENLTARSDVLLSATSPAAQRVVVTRNPRGAPLVVASGLAVPARAATSLSPFGADLVLVRPRALIAGQHVLLRLTFRHAGAISVDAQVTAPGSP